jgi:hypothetical protein
MRWIFILAASTLISCEVLLFEEKPNNDPISNFDFLWNTVNERYSLFETKGVNWDSIYHHFRPRVNANLPDQGLYDICLAMLATLRDGHVYLSGNSSIPRYPFDNSQLGPRNFNRTLINENYLRNDYKEEGGLRYKIIDQIAYIYYESFLTEITEEHLDKLMSDLDGVRGVVLDIRDNGGGNPRFAFILGSRFIDRSLPVLYSQAKNGPGRNDYTPKEEIVLRPSTGKKFNGPLIILTNRGTFSAANLFAGMLRAFPNVRVFGTISGGGGGVPAVSELPNGWKVAYTTSRITLANGYEIERGIPLDRQVLMTNSQTLLGRDNVIESAFTEIKSMTP